MTDYLNHNFDWADESINWIYEDLPQWSAMSLSLFMKYVPMKQNIKVLDLGAGTGIPSLELAQRLGAFSMVYAVDSWKDGLKKAKQKAALMGLSNLKFVSAEGDDLPFEDGYFNMVTANLLINNVYDREAVLRECHRVTGDSGTISIGTNLMGQMSEFYDVFEAVLTEMEQEEALASLRAHCRKRESIESLTSLLAKAGFQVKRVESEENCFRFLDGTSMLNHFIIKEAFLDEWRRLLEPEDEKVIFSKIEENLNQYAKKEGELKLTVPLAYIEADKI